MLAIVVKLGKIEDLSGVIIQQMTELRRKTEKNSREIFFISREIDFISREMDFISREKESVSPD
ncbi:MAG: hypothetical protein LBU34_07970, partial [Planctomycetaceae bacterium]|nr:hypothetical protein [Planctomycetaceae bacterium]